MYRTLKEGETRQELEKITVRSLFLEVNKNKLVSMYVIHCGLHYLVSFTYSSVG